MFDGGYMGLFDNLTSVLAQYVSGTAPATDAATHFDQVAQSVDSGTLAQGIAAAMHSDQTPPFSQIVSQLFSSGSGDQKTAMLNTLLSSVGPAQRAQLAALIPGLGGATTVTSEQASAVSPTAVQSVAQHVEQHDPGIVEKMSSLYAEHPTLVKTLGSAAMMIAMRKIAQRQNA
jgi:hypothetical protein